MFSRNENRNEGTFGCSLGTRNRNKGTFACSPGTKTGMRVHSPKPPFYETALLSPGEMRGNRTESLREENLVQKRSQKFTVMKFEVFQGETYGGFIGGNLFLSFALGKIDLKFVTKIWPHSSHWSSQWAKNLLMHLVLKKLSSERVFERTSEKRPWQVPRGTGRNAH